MCEEWCKVHRVRTVLMDAVNTLLQLSEGDQGIFGQLVNDIDNEHLIPALHRIDHFAPAAAFGRWSVGRGVESVPEDRA